MPHRILHVCHNFPPELDGGVQRVVHGLIRHQRDLGHAAAVASGSFRADPKGAVVPQEWDAIPVTRIHARPEEAFSGDRGSARIGDAVLAAAADFAADICHVHHWFHLSNDLVRRLRAAGHRVVVTLHDPYSTCPRLFRQRNPGRVCAPDLPLSECAACVQPALGAGHPLAEIEGNLQARHAAYRDELRAADRVWTVSDFLRDLITAVPAFRDQDVEVIPLGITRTGLGPVPAPAPLPGQLRLLHFAGIAELKGIALILDAIAQTPDPEAFRLTLYGDESRPGLVRAWREQHPELRLEHRGAFRGDAGLMAAAADADLAVMPSELPESYGLAADEALAMGLPLIVGDLGAPRERITGRGWQVPVADPGPLAKLLEQLRRDPESCGAMRTTAPLPHAFGDHCDAVLRSYDRVCAG